jgi:subtilisin family serine protease
MPPGKGALNSASVEPYLDDSIVPPVVPTGNWLVKFDKSVRTDDATKLLQSKLGGNSQIASSGDFRSSTLNVEKELNCATGILLERIGVALLRGTEEVSSRSNELMELPGVTAFIQELLVFTPYGDGAGLQSSSVGPPDLTGDFPLRDTPDLTWGIDALGGGKCKRTGRGIKLAILDTGLDVAHPDFAARTNVNVWSAFGCRGADIKGHGTHCAGTATGPRAANGRRYGVAPGADLYMYKVLNDRGDGKEGDTLTAIDRAIADGCQVISMSLGRGVGEATAVHPIFESVASAALDAGVLLVAAAGNSSSRDLGIIAPVEYPANCPSIMAVAAIDSRLAVPNFSNGTVAGRSGVVIGGVDIAGPGAGVFSCSPVPRMYERLRGTSMAVPHVAGAACLWAETDINLRGRRLWEALISHAKSLKAGPRDVGAGLVQLPFTEH